MGTQLKADDILGLIDKEEPKDAAEPKPKATRPKKDIAALKSMAEEAAAGKPSAFQSDLRVKLRDQVQFSFGRIPRFIYDQFEDLAVKAGMNKREYLYHLLREQGANIPPYDQMDGRKL